MIEPGRWIPHTGWVACEDVSLTWFCRRGSARCGASRVDRGREGVATGVGGAARSRRKQGRFHHDQDAYLRELVLSSRFVAMINAG
jgi:hypothetical protein